MDNKKEAERTELHRAIWNIANDLRGAVDGWDFKQYVLGMLFYRYISENLTNFINKGEHEAGNQDFDYAKIAYYLLNLEITQKFLRTIIFTDSKRARGAPDYSGCYDAETRWYPRNA